MGKDRYCGLCACDGPIKDTDRRWSCPLLGGNICSRCCHHELYTGMGPSFILKEVCDKTGKTPQEVHATCKACPYFKDPDLEEWKMVGKKTPDRLRSHARFVTWWGQKIRWLRGDRPDYPATKDMEIDWNKEKGEKHARRRGRRKSSHVPKKPPPQKNVGTGEGE